jgi:hypothetical protein
MNIQVILVILFIGGLIAIVTFSRLFNLNDNVAGMIWGWYALLIIFISVQINKKEEGKND